MLRLIDLTLARGSVPLIERATLTINPGRHVGIVGANGAGKSTLFAALRGLLTAERGDIAMPNGWVIAHVAQETPASDKTALEYALDGDVELREVEAQLAAENEHPNADASKHGEILAHLYSHLETIGGYAAPARAAELLAGLGFEHAMQSRAVAEFSGGWRMRLNLAQALMCRSDLLLLDEPTNHLDLDAVLWIEDWLSRYTGTLLVITHDRDFIDRVSDQILFFDTSNPKAPAKLKLYTGNYESFEAQRTVELEVQQGAFEKQQRTIKHLESFITRFKAKATKAAQAQSRMKALEKLERISAAHVDSPFTFSFRKPEGEPRQLLKFDNVALGYDDKNILENVKFSLLPNSRIGLLGKNGAGKSTLVKAIAGELRERMGERVEGQHLKIAYFAQHQLEQLRNDESALWHLDQLDKQLTETRGYTRAREQEQRNFLGGFDFRGDRVSEPVGVFSGGERARLVLALLVYERPNLLLLDEPTNHLDMEMRQALTLALQDYEGALVVVAHDRHILRACCDELWLVADSTVKPFDGDLDDYRDWLREQRTKPAKEKAIAAKEKAAAVAAEKLAVEVIATAKKPDRREDAEERQRLANLRRPLQKRIDAIEKELGKLTLSRDALDAWLASEAAYAPENAADLGTKTRERGELAAKIAVIETEWMEKQDELQWVR
ncbi:MAG: ATP-binding cassette domain-containing protein [Betaproteobacteria bacterium]|nr:MAG: ATP-binding cassette domain-containing protein [Betaproteobacteria bacterium]